MHIRNNKQLVAMQLSARVQVIAGTACQIATSLQLIRLKRAGSVVKLHPSEQNALQQRISTRD